MQPGLRPVSGQGQLGALTSQPLRAFPVPLAPPCSRSRPLAAPRRATSQEAGSPESQVESLLSRVSLSCAPTHVPSPCPLSPALLLRLSPDLAPGQGSDLLPGPPNPRPCTGLGWSASAYSPPLVAPPSPWNQSQASPLGQLHKTLGHPFEARRAGPQGWGRREHHTRGVRAWAALSSSPASREAAYHWISGKMLAWHWGSTLPASPPPPAPNTPTVSSVSLRNGSQKPHPAWPEGHSEATAESPSTSRLGAPRTGFPSPHPQQGAPRTWGPEAFVLLLRSGSFGGHSWSPKTLPRPHPLEPHWLRPCSRPSSAHPSARDQGAPGGWGRGKSPPLAGSLGRSGWGGCWAEGLVPWWAGADVSPGRRPAQGQCGASGLRSQGARRP